MSKSEILAELPRLGRDDRVEILDRLWDLEEADAVHSGPTDADKAILDRELADFQRDGNAGESWQQAEQRLRSRK